MAHIATPHGLTQLKKAFGNPLEFVNDKAKWQKNYLKTVKLPGKPLRYAYDKKAKITHITTHKLVSDITLEAIMKIQEAKVDLVYGGCYVWRPKRSNPTILSTHTWGISIDWDPANNQMGKKWKDDGIMLSPIIIKAFQAVGFEWGGDWQYQDAMHVQYCTGY